MASTTDHPAAPAELWDEAHVKSLLRFPRFPFRLIQQDPWQTWVSQRGGLKAIYTFLQNYPLSPNHRRILEVVLSNPEAIADVYANRLNISRATYFYQLRELVPALVQALNLWQVADQPATPTASPVASPPASNLPTPLTSLVGLEPALETLIPTFLNKEVRLLTLLGPGGIGKTRFGIELAHRLANQFADGVCFVDLTILHDPALVAATIAQALGLKELGSEQTEAQLKAYLRDKEFLLLLDNFEHLMAAALLVTDLLAAAPNLKILVTSRSALHVYGEYEYTLAPLALPSPDSLQELKQLSQSAAATLFIQRAQAVNAAFTLNTENFKAVAELCLQMEGIPLAIELAASQIKYFSPQALLIRLANSKRLVFFNQGFRRLPPRQQTLRGMLDWSYRLLTPELQTLFSRLSIFAGGCTIEAVTAICTTPASNDIPTPVEVGLTALVDQSLLQQQVEPNGEPRFHMLGISREYALERADLRGEIPQLQRAHALYYLNLVEQADDQEDEYLSPAKIESLRRDYPNHKAAIQWALENRESEIGLRLIAVLWNFWNHSTYQQEGRQITQAALEQTATLRVAARARVLRFVGWLALNARDYTTMLRSFQSSLEISEELGDQQSVGLSLHGLAQLAQLRGQWQQAQIYLGQALSIFKDLADQKQLAWTRAFSGQLALSQADLTTAQTCLQESLKAFRALNSKRGLIFTLGYLGRTFLYQSELIHALPLLEECRALSTATEEAHSSLLALALNHLGEIALYQNRLTHARELISDSLTLSKDEGYSGQTELGSFTFGLLAMREGRYLSAAQCLRESLLIQQLLKEQGRSLLLLETVGALLVARQEYLGAARLYGAAAALRAAFHIPQLPLYQPEHEHSQQIIHTQLDPATLAEALTAGQSLSLDQSLAYALRCVE